MDSTGALDLPDIPKTLLVIAAATSDWNWIGVRHARHKGHRRRNAVGLLPGADRDLVLPLHKRLEKLFSAILLNTTVKSLKDERPAFA